MVITDWLLLWLNTTYRTAKRGKPKYANNKKKVFVFQLCYDCTTFSVFPVFNKGRIVSFLPCLLSFVSISCFVTKAIFPFHLIDLLLFDLLDRPFEESQASNSEQKNTDSCLSTSFCASLLRLLWSVIAMIINKTIFCEGERAGELSVTLQSYCHCSDYHYNNAKYTQWFQKGYIIFYDFYILKQILPKITLLN